MNYLKNKVNKIKLTLKRSKTFSEYNSDKKLLNKTDNKLERANTYPCYNDNDSSSDNVMVVRCCSSSYCELCKEMVFQSLEKCHNCYNEKICVYCYNKGNTLCNDCDYDLMNLLEDEIEITKKKTINDFVDQLL